MNWDYIAGFFDGEGCLTVCERKDQKGVKYQLAISQTNKDVLERIQKISGVGKVYEANHTGNKNWKPYWAKPYTFRISKREDILFFLSKIENKLIVKKDEIIQKKNILLELDKKRGQKIEQIRKDLKICKEMRDDKKSWKEIGLVLNKKPDAARNFVKGNKYKDIYKDIFGV